MHRTNRVVAVLLLALPVMCLADTYVKPTTTLKAQTANNTSAADSFLTQTNGNLGAGNVSKGDIHSLLYAGSTTKVYAHLMPWFGKSNHMNVGYSSIDPAQVTRQINDMISRGIDGVIIDWYGPGTYEDQATELIMAEAEKHPGFSFAIMIDQGAIEWDSCSGCSPQQALISQLQYIEQKYFVSKAYMAEQGRPVVTNFNIDLSYKIDWTAVNAALATHPLFIFQNNDGFTHVLSDGSYSWVMPTSTDYGMSYLSGFYGAGLSLPNESTVGATYKGFNDTLAAWGSGRIMKQQCGQTWLQTFSKANGLYNSGKQLPYLQLVTWNDYEEGTEIESGIDSCFSLSATVAAGALKWSISGNESTVDHYRTYISSDGQNLMTLADTAAGIHSINLCSFSIPPGNYKLFVQAVGKPTLANRMPGAISYSPACGGGSATVSFSASPGTVTLQSGNSTKVTVTAKAQSGSFNDSILLSCSGLPAALSCSFSPAAIVPGTGTATSTLTIASVAVAGRNVPQGSHGFSYAAWFLPFGIAGFTFMGKLPKLRGTRSMLLILTIAGTMLLTISCGGGTSFAQHAGTVPAGTYRVAVHGSSNTAQLDASVMVTLQ